MHWTLLLGTVIIIFIAFVIVHFIMLKIPFETICKRKSNKELSQEDETLKTEDDIYATVNVEKKRVDRLSRKAKIIVERDYENLNDEQPNEMTDLSQNNRNSTTHDYLTVYPD